MKSPNLELRRLTDAWHEGTISPEDGMRLEQRLAADDSARTYFFEIAEIEAAMAAAASDLPLTIPAHSLARRTNWQAMAAVFVGGLFCGALALKLLPSLSPVAPAQKPPAALVTGMLGVAWDSTSTERSLALSAGSAEAKIDTGLIELTFASGTRALVEGPAAFQILGDNSIRLARGKLVADVPRGAEGFSVTYPDGKIVDLGTEFGVEIASSGRSANFGVFRGEIEFHPRSDANQAVHLLEDHALLAENNSIISVPFDQQKFARKLPSREFAWKIQGDAPNSTVFEYDISHLVWKPGDYRAICKWMTGRDGVFIDSAELLLDGQRVVEALHLGFTGTVGASHDNSYKLDISADAYRRGRWTLRIHARVDRAAEGPADFSGVVLLEEGLTFQAIASDFIGTWEYFHNGMVYHRKFKADGTASMTIDGKTYAAFDNSHWQIENGTLVLNVPTETGKWLQERHLLRDSRTLVFVDCPYRNATRVDEPSE